MSAGEPIILDHGTGFVRAGPANPDNDPPVVMPTVMCPVEDMPLVNGNQVGGGNHGVLDIEWAAANTDKAMRPIERGLIKDWDLMEDMWRYILYSLCGWEANNEGQVLITEPLHTPKWARERLTQVMFETFNTSGLFMTEQAVLSLYSVGKISGCAVDLGHGKIDIAPVWEGAVQHSAIRQIELAGQDLTAFMRRRLSQSSASRASASPCSSSSAAAAAAPSSLLQIDEAAAEAVKDRHATVAEDDEAYADAIAGGAEKVKHTLPDGQVIEVGAERYEVGEALFRPLQVLGSEEEGLSEQVFQAVSAACMPFENTRQILESIVLCGGTATMTGLDTRFLKELSQLTPPSIRPAVIKPADYMPDSSTRNAAWMGGAILAKVVFPQNQHVTKAEYDEAGPYVIHRKCYTG